MHPDRRALLRALVGLPFSVPARATAATDARTAYVVEEHEVPGSPSPLGPVVVLRPRKPRRKKLPLIVALHGRGETSKPPRQGAFGWPSDYGLRAWLEAAAVSPVDPSLLSGIGDPRVLARANARWRDRGAPDLCFVCPYYTDVEAHRPDDARPLMRYIAEQVLPWAQAALPVEAHASMTAIDGVSLGGYLALRTACEYPAHFRAVGGIQPAMNRSDVGAWRRRLERAWAANPNLELRLLTSDGDFFQEGVEGLHRALASIRRPHRYQRVHGPHDYLFNRTFGSLALIDFHEEVFTP
jgi:pimeloyl-ACP methyl ester carboxylesterase